MEINNQIKEDFCNKDICIALRSIGFKVPCEYCYPDTDWSWMKVGEKVGWAGASCVFKSDDVTFIPSIALVKKWLWENFKYYIKVGVEDNEKEGEFMFSYTLFRFKSELEFLYRRDGFKNEKDANEAAIWFTCSIISDLKIIYHVG